MRNVLAIAGKELRAYFHSPIGYVVLAIWATIVGPAFYVHLMAYMAEIFRMQMMGGMGAPPISLNEVIIRPLLNGFVIILVLLIVIPVISMRLFAEERRGGTMELLLTSPLTDLEIIVGKYLGALALYVALALLTLAYIGLLFVYGNPDAKPVIANALGLLFAGASLLAIGMWISTLSRNQIIACFATMGLFVILIILGWVGDLATGPVGSAVGNLSFTRHMDNFAKGVIDTGDALYFFSAIFLGIFLTARSVDALKGKP